MKGKLISATRNIIERAQEANVHEVSMSSYSQWNFKNKARYSPNWSNNSAYNSYKKKVWMNIELASKNSADTDFNTYKKSFYKDSSNISNENKNSMNRSSRSLDKGLNHSKFIYE